MTEVSQVNDPERLALMRADETFTFGPSFFLGHLGRFVRDQCPAAEEQLPFVEIRLADGHTLDLCHVIGVSARWVMLAVREAPTHPTDMAIEIVPYQMVQGVRIHSRHPDATTVGFTQSHLPAIVSAETLAETALVHALTSAR